MTFREQQVNWNEALNLLMKFNTDTDVGVISLCTLKDDGHYKNRCVLIGNVQDYDNIIKAIYLLIKLVAKEHDKDIIKVANVVYNTVVNNQEKDERDKQTQ
jgi:hypothetical protein